MRFSKPSCLSKLLITRAVCVMVCRIRFDSPMRMRAGYKRWSMQKEHKGAERERNATNCGSARRLFLLARVVIEQIMCEPFDRLVRSHLHQLAHSLEEEWHDSLIEVRADWERLQRRLRVGGTRSGLALSALRKKGDSKKNASVQRRNVDSNWIQTAQEIAVFPSSRHSLAVVSQQQACVSGSLHVLTDE